MNCPVCGTQISGGNFCPNCGANLRTPEHVIPAITIQFGYSTSQNYKTAVDFASTLPEYSISGEGRTILHSVSLGFEDINPLSKLLSLVGHWKSTVFMVNGREIPPSEIIPVLNCYVERSKAYNPEEYCFGRDDAEKYNDNDLGCRWSRINPYGWHGLAGFGTVGRDGSFRVDKNRLVYEVAKNLEPYRICPALNVDKIKTRLESIPSVINPNVMKEWEYVTEYHDGKDIAIAVRKRSKTAERGYVVKDHDEFQVEVAVGDLRENTAGNGCLLPVLFVVIVSAIALIQLVV